MRELSLNWIIFAATSLLMGCTLFFVLARLGFCRAWDEFRALRQERVARASGLLSPALESARFDPFRHLPQNWAPEGLRFSPVGVAVRYAQETRPLFAAIQGWEEHHRSVSKSFLDALGHVAHHRLVPHADLHEKIAPIGDIVLRLVEECPEPSLQKELRMAYSGLRTGADQNLEYISRKMVETAHETRTAFHMALGNAHSQFDLVRGELLESLCNEAAEEVGKFLENHSGFKINPFAWGRQTAFYREFEQLRDELALARKSGDLSQIALIVVMIVEDENRFVVHLNAASRLHDEFHQRLSHELCKSAEQLHLEAHQLSGWATKENQRLQSAVSHQLIQHLETWKASTSDLPQCKGREERLSLWISELSKLRDLDPDLLANAA